MFNRCRPGTIEWARAGIPQETWEFGESLDEHWSRVFEYPWILANGNFRLGQVVLDAAGGEAVLQYHLAKHGLLVVNVDLKPPKSNDKNIITVKGNVGNLNFADGAFERVVCASALEHMEDPVKAVKELWRVLAPGGRLLVTMDIAEYERRNHSVDSEVAQEIVGMFGLKIPKEPKDILTRYFPEIKPKRGEPKEVLLKVLCWFVDKTGPILNPVNQTDLFSQIRMKSLRSKYRNKMMVIKN